MHLFQIGDNSLENWVGATLR